MRLVIASGDGRRWKPVVANGQVPTAINEVARLAAIGGPSAAATAVLPHACN
jgi:hypothetical protein